MSCPFLRVHLISKCVLHTDRSSQHLTDPDIFVRHRLLLLYSSESRSALRIHLVVDRSVLGYYTTTGLRTYPGQVRIEKTTFFYSLAVGLRNRLWFYSLNDKGSWEKDLVCCDESLILVQSESSALRLMLIGRMRRVVLQNGKIGKTGNGTQWTGTHRRRSSSDKLFKLF